MAQCQDCIPNTPSPVKCGNNRPGCILTLPGTCLLYTGNPIAELNIAKNDDFNTIVNKLAQYSIDHSGGGSCVAVDIVSISGDQNINVGQTLSMSVTASGTTPITYQWQKQISSVYTNISGATSSTYSVSNAQTTASGNYRVILTNDCGTTTSNPIAVTVTAISLVTVYWGWLPASDTVTLAAWKANPALMATSGSGSSGQITHNATIVADYTSNNQPQILVMAEPTTETAKTKWFVTSVNNGSIGGSEDTFGAPSTQAGFRFYQSAFETQQTDDPVEFRIT